MIASLLLSITLASAAGTPPADGTAAKAKFVNLLSCPEPARAVVTKEKLPGAEIVSCTAAKRKVEGSPAWVVRLTHGDEKDPLMAVVIDSPRTIARLPGKSESEIRAKVMEKLLNSMSGKRDLDCDKDAGDLLDVQIGKYRSGHAWKIGFRKKFTCTWTEVLSTQVENGKAEAQGRKWSSKTGGVVYAYLQDGVTRFDISHLEQRQSQAGRVKLKEPATDAPVAGPSGAAR